MIAMYFHKEESYLMKKQVSSFRTQRLADQTLKMSVVTKFQLKTINRFESHYTLENDKITVTLSTKMIFWILT